MSRRSIAAAALALPLLVGSGGAAQAASDEYRPPQVKWVSDAESHGDTATLKARYRCWGGNEGTHLWVSLKQGKKLKGSADDLAAQEGTSAISRAWYDSHPTTLDCNGKWHTQRFTVQRELANPANPSHPEAWEQLRDGRAFMQFCLFDSTAPEVTGPGPIPEQGFAYKYEWVEVDAHKG